jgi:hypothetical protein
MSKPEIRIILEMSLDEYRKKYLSLSERFPEGWEQRIGLIDTWDLHEGKYCPVCQHVRTNCLNCRSMGLTIRCCECKSETALL